MSSTHQRSSNVHEATHQVAQEPIAICGMSVRLPGGINSPQEFWEFLIAKGDARGMVPISRYNSASYASLKTKPGTTTTEYGYFLDENVDIGTIDTSFFSIGKSEAERMDPHQRQMLEVARECMEDAGEIGWKGRPIGCYIGSFGEDWVEMFAKENQQYGLHRVGGYGDFMLANRISYEMGLMGPSILVRTACSASLVALNQACAAIARGECHGAIVGGANLIIGPGMTIAMSEQGVLSRDGSCKTFSADADGYARGEAVSAIFIKRLADAIDDGNPIRAIIRATATNSDGRSALGIHVPNDDAQESLIRNTYYLAGISDFSQTAFVECHGTGTPVGDPIEVRAVGRVFGPSGGVQIGSVKPNIGHSEGASGLTSLIKSVLALENGQIPPNIKCSPLNPHIPWEEYRLSVPTNAMPWPAHRKERISINSFGIGGSNAHVILDSAKSFGISSPVERVAKAPQLLLYSANTVDSLMIMIENYRRYVLRNPNKIEDLAFTLSSKREHLVHRAFAIVNLLGGIQPSLPSKTSAMAGIAMVFTGQGAQWPEMGRCLISSESFPVFRKTLQFLDRHLHTIASPPNWSIEDELLKPTNISGPSHAEKLQPLCTALQIALVDTLQSIGIYPTAVLGHSSGEIAAAYAAGAINAADAIEIAFFRGMATRLQKKNGTMAAIGLGSEVVRPYLHSGSCIACENSPRSVTIAGDRDAISSTIEKIRIYHQDIQITWLKVDKAYHSPHMTEIGDHYGQLIKHLSSKPTKCLFFSSLKGNLLNENCQLGPNYWQRNLESPVLFNSACQKLLCHELASNLVLLEVGPHSALRGPIRQIQEKVGNRLPYLSTLKRNQNDIEALLTTVGSLYNLGFHINLNKIIPSGSILSDLPRYPWDHSRRFWYESRLSKNWRCREHKSHDLLGVRVEESTDFDVSFRNILHSRNIPWLQDHKIKQDIVFPFAGYAAMIGEALQQLSGTGHGFKLRKVIVQTALVVHSNSPTEVITNLRRQKLTVTSSSEWWEFSIATFNGKAWTKHCIGEAKCHSEGAHEVENREALIRKVPKRRCYDAMARGGLHYGPAFQRLYDIRSDTLTQAATAQIVAKETDTQDYLLHPTIIDASLQLLTVAATKGYTNTSTGMVLPTHIEEACILESHTDLVLRASTHYTPNKSIIGSVKGVTKDGRIVMSLSGIRLTRVYDESDTADEDGFSRAEWQPHIDFMNVGTLIKPPEDQSAQMRRLSELSLLCMVHTKRAISGLSSPNPHLEKYRQWIGRQTQLEDVQLIEQLENCAIEGRVESVVRELSQSVSYGPALAMQRILKNAHAIFAGSADPLELLLSDGALNKLYDSMDQCDESAFFEHLSHATPNLRILEIGAGTGGSTAKILKHLTPQGRKLYSTYHFTDISSGFLNLAKQRFASYEDIEYFTLDISQDPDQQELDGCKYDLIVASNVIHATPSIRDSLCNIRKLLNTQGRLLLHELTPRFKWVNYIWGTLHGWWCGGNDGRTDEPYIDTNRWIYELMSAGFQSPDAIVLDSVEPYQLGAVMIARPVMDMNSQRRVTLLQLSPSENSKSMVQHLSKKGYMVTCCGLDEKLPVGDDILAFLDGDESFFESMDEYRLRSFKRLVHTMGSSGILWITGSSQVNCRDPRFGQISGIARSLRSEMLVDFAVCEVDAIGDSMESIAAVFHKFQHRNREGPLNPDFEYAIVKNVVHVGRFHQFSPGCELSRPSEEDVAVLTTSEIGRLDSLHWACEEKATLRTDCVEIKVHSVGLNFRDILGVIGIMETPNNGFGLEASGIVQRVGTDVQELEVGDRVMLLSSRSFQTDLIVSEDLCERIPAGLSFEDAATIPCVFATAAYCLFEVANITKGQSILIHSACGGVGLAAIQLSQMVGAEIYVTVSSEKKIRFLMENYNLPRRRIFSSRSEMFLESIMEETKGRGVDIALNSLTGELLHATWKCIAEFGKMIEIGKRDLTESGKLDMNPFLANRSYSCVDLDMICAKKPKLAKRLLKIVVGMLRERFIHPIRPITTFNSDEIVDGFRFMQQGIHLGKIVISIRDSQGTFLSHLSVTKCRKAKYFDDTSAFLLVGGLGGLGRSVSTWMVEHGARHLIYLSPSAGSKTSHHEFAEELLSMGCRVDMIAGSVSSLRDVIKAITKAEGRLKGILQMSMALGNQNFPKMTIDEWKAPIDPKVRGTWNLHNVSLSEKANLDFFVLFSSISGVCGQPGQTNYSGANTFMDTFAQYRQSLGLVACSIQIGAVEEVGFLAEHDAIKQKLKAAGALPAAISEKEFLMALELAMEPMSINNSSGFRGSICLGLRTDLPLTHPKNRLLWKKDMRMAVFHNKKSPTMDSHRSDFTDKLQSFLNSAKADPYLLERPESHKVLAVEIGAKALDLLLKPKDDLVTWLSISELGVDSLVAIELRQWWRLNFEFDISVLELLGAHSLEILGKQAADGMLRIFQGREAGNKTESHPDKDNGQASRI